MRLLLVVALIGVAFASIALSTGCRSGPQPIAVHAEDSGQPSGSVALVFTRPAKGITVAVDGVLVVSRAHTDSITIDGVTAGITEIRIAAGSGPGRLERELRVDVEVGRTTTVPLGAPEAQESSGLLNAAFSIAAIVISTAVTNWLF